MPCRCAGRASDRELWGDACETSPVVRLAWAPLRQVPQYTGRVDEAPEPFPMTCV
jgi:hypothetical protein